LRHDSLEYRQIVKGAPLKDTRAEDILSVLAHGPQTSRALAERFNLSRQAVHYHLKELREQGLVRQVRKARAAFWEPVYDLVLTWGLGDEPLEEDAMWRQFLAVHGPLDVSDDTRACLDYGVTEMLNNAIDHSGGTEIALRGRVGDATVEFVVNDDGIGAFRHVVEHFDLPSELDAIAHIAKGQQTTDPSRHSGQGLFFTSKLFDQFELDSGTYIWAVDNLRDDTTVAPGTGRQGTSVLLVTRRQGTRSPKDVFDRFTNTESYELDRTIVKVALTAHGKDFISRSEAKRLAVGLELYGVVELDFQGVDRIGQGFVDELFRVWASQHPNTEFRVVNASPEVEFMIRRGLPRT